MDRDAEVYCRTTIAEIVSNGIPRVVGVMTTKQSILVKKTDIYEIGKLLVDHIIFTEQPKEEVEPEIEVFF